MSNEIRFLILDDNLADAEYLKKLLNIGGFDFLSETVQTREAFVDALEVFKPDLVFADYNLPSFDGLSALRIVRKDYPLVPVIIISGSVGEDIAVDTLKEGASDYLLKDRLSRLVSSTKRVLDKSNKEKEVRVLEEHLKDSEALLRVFLDSIPEEAFLINTEGKVLVANKTLAKRLGLSFNKLIGSSIFDLIMPELVKIRKENISNVISTGVPVYYEETRNERVIDNFIYPVLDKGRTVTKLAVLSYDVTMRKHVEMALEYSEKKYRQLVENLTEGIWMINKNGSTVFVNEYMAQMLGYSADDITGMPLYEFVDKKSQALIAEHLEKQKSGIKEQYEAEFNGKNRKHINVLLSCAPIIDDDKEYAGVLFAVQDITVKKQLEMELRQSQKMEAIGRLAGGVAHDFNNILSIIAGYSDFITEDMDEESELFKNIDEIRKAGKRAAMLTSQLLAFSRKQPLNPSKNNLNTVVMELKEMLERLIGEDIELITNLDPELKPVFIDVGQNQQVIMNLVINAKDAMPKGGKLTITTRNIVIDKNSISVMPESHAGEFACLIVSDTGTGMSKETMAHIFEPFFSLKTPGKGTGLGLAMIYGIIKQQNGWINAYSEPARGSEFKIYLPVYYGEDETPVKEPVLPEVLEGNGERILLVEDEDGIRKFAINVLKDHNYKVFAAGTAQEAFKIFEDEKGNFDIIFTDSVLPDKSGIDVIDHFLKQNRGLKVLLSSGYLDDKSQWPVIKEKGYPFMPKPYGLNDLLKNIRLAIKK